MQDFIKTQLYSDEEWEKNIKNGFNSNTTEENPIEMLRQSLLKGMDIEDEEIETIIKRSETPTFANTIVALSTSGKLLERASNIMYNLLSANTNNSLDALANEMASRLSEHANNIMLNPALFEKIKVVYDNPPQNLTGEERMLLDKTYESFERSGATLNEEDKKKFRQITSKLSECTLKFSQNLLKETSDYFLHITDEAQLAGIPQIHQQAAANEARERNLDGWVFTLHAPSYVPFMMYAEKRELREKLYLAYQKRCTHEGTTCNFPLVTDIVNLRRELAQLLGYKNYADYALLRRMAENPQVVNSLLNDLISHYKAKAHEEVSEVEQRAHEEMGEDFILMPWDYSYFCQKLKQERYQYDSEMLRPYFELSQVKKGIFNLATQLYGISFERDETIPVYHPDVEVYRVYDNNHRYLALFFLDFFTRPNKQGGAWMTNYRNEHCDCPATEEVTPENSLRPVVSIVTNFTKPTAEQPSLLTLSEVETFLHEFGHALHGIFAMTHFEALSGTSVFWDFVELPSQFMENFAVEPAFLSTFAKHYQTGEALPQEYIERIRKVRNFQVGYACMRQVSFALLDMAYYTMEDAFAQDVRSFEQESWKEVQLLPIVPEACMSVQFGHIMSGGYAAGYYSYKWSEILDADAFSFLKEHGIFDKQTAKSFRDNILSKGGTENPMNLYVRYRGKRPSINALLKRDGMVVNS